MGLLARIWTALGRGFRSSLVQWAPAWGEAAGRARAAFLGRPYLLGPPRIALPTKGGPVDGTDFREEYYSPLAHGWTLLSIRAALQLANDGDMRYVADLLEYLCLGDERVRSKIEDRCLALTSAPITFELAPKGRLRKRAAKAAQAEEDWWDMLPETEHRQMISWRLGLGMALGEMVWVEPEPLIPITQRNDGTWHVDTAKPKMMARIRHGRNVPRVRCWGCRALRYCWEERRWYVRLDGNHEEPLRWGNGKWIFWAAGENRPWLQGLWRGLAIVVLLKHLANLDWGKQGNKYAAGVAIMSGPEAYDQELRRQLTQEWRQMGSAGVIWVPEGSKLDVFELKANSHQTYKDQIDTANRAIDIAITGANLPTESANGANTGANAQQRTVNKREAGDAAEWETVEREQMGKPWAKANFGDANVAPWAIRMVAPPADKAQMANMHKAAAEGLRILRGEGAPIDEVAFLQAYDFTIDQTRVGQRAKPTLFAWHVTSSMLSFGEARERYDDTLPATPWDKLRFADVMSAANPDPVAQAAFKALVERLPKDDINASA